MKKLLFIIGMVGLVFTLTACANKPSIDTIDFSDIEQLSYQADELDEDLEEPSEPLNRYMQEVRQIHASIQRLKEEIKGLVDNIKPYRDQYQDGEITLEQTDKDQIIQAIKSVRLNRYMLGQTMGQAYQPLMTLYQNRDQYNQEEAREILVNVYHTLNARQQMYEHIVDALTDIYNHIQ